MIDMKLVWNTAIADAESITKKHGEGCKDPDALVHAIATVIAAGLRSVVIAYIRECEPSKN